MNKNKNVVFFLLIGTFKKKWKISHLLFFDKRHQNWRFCNNGMEWAGRERERSYSHSLSYFTFYRFDKKIRLMMSKLTNKNRDDDSHDDYTLIIIFMNPKVKGNSFLSLFKRKKLLIITLLKKKYKKKEFPNIILY